MYKLILIYTLISLIPFILTVVKLVGIKKLREFTKQQRTEEKKALENYVDETYHKEREQYYIQAKNIFSDMMKHRMLSRGEILTLKKMLRESLGSYEKNYREKYQNDAHEIYSMMKDKHIDVKEWQDIISYMTKEGI